MQKEVTLVQQREHVGLIEIGQDVDGLQSRIAKRLEPRLLDEPHQDAQVERARHAVDVLRLQFQPAAQSGFEVAGCGRFHLDAHRIAPPPPSQLAFDYLEVRDPPFVVQLELRIASDANHARFENLLPAEQLRQVRADDVFEQYERHTLGRGDLNEPGQAGRNLDDREALAGIVNRRFEQEREVQAQRRQQGKRPRDVDGQRGQDRQDLVAEERRQRCLPGRIQFGKWHEPDAVRRECGKQVVQGELVQGRHKRVCAPADVGELLTGGQTGQIDGRIRFLDHLFQTCDPHHEELVEIRRGYRDELRALEQRRIGIDGFFDHPFVECQP